jgi:hypothetical protein
LGFFKVNRSSCNKNITRDIEPPEKLKYVVDENGKGYWVKPKPPMPIDYEEDIYY